MPPSEIQTAISDSVAATLSVSVAKEQREREKVAAENQRVADKHAANITATQLVTLDVFFLPKKLFISCKNILASCVLSLIFNIGY